MKSLKGAVKNMSNWKAWHILSNISFVKSENFVRSHQASKIVMNQNPQAAATSEAELNILLDQIEQEIGMDEELTQDLLDILNDEEKLKEEEVSFNKCRLS